MNRLEEDLDHILSKTSSLWEAFRNKTIFVTGGTGFFGIWIQLSFTHINQKLGLNSKMIILTRSKTTFLAKNPSIVPSDCITFIEGDVCSFDFPEGDIDFIIHAATEASVKLNSEEPLKMFETVVNGSRRVLEFAKLKRVKSFLLTSSGAVYGIQPSDIPCLAEDFNGAPKTTDALSVYGEGKRMAEVLCSVYFKHFNLPVKIARCYAFVGPYLPVDSHFAAGNFVRNVINDEDIVLQGDGTPFRSYMYASDLMVWLWTILFRGENNRPYNVGSNQGISIKELAETISRYSTTKLKVFIKTPKLDMPVQRYVPNIDRACSELNLEIYTTLEDSLRKTIDFNKKDLN